MRIIYIFISFLIILNSCKEDINPFSQFSQLNIPMDENVIVYVIPGSGCTGCITNAEQIALSHEESSKTYFLFTRIRSLKTFKAKFSGMWRRSNVILDSLNIFQFPDESKVIYPIKFIYANNKFEVEKYLEP